MKYRKTILFYLVLFLFFSSCNFSPEIISADLAKEKQEDYEIVGDRVFQASDGPFYLLVQIKNPVKGTIVKAVWYMGTESIEENLINENEVSLPGDQKKISFSINRIQDRWPSGSYMVELWLNNKLVRNIEFMVQ
jgi:hypothetical protein